MNRGRKIKQMRRFINKYGVVDKEYKMPPSRHYAPYRKGSYCATFESYDHELVACVVGVDKYQVYKGVIETLKELKGNDL